MQRTRTLLLIVVLLTLVSGCVNRDQIQKEIADNRLFWAQSGIDDYQFTLTRYCFCSYSGKPLHVTVTNNEIVGIIDDEGQDLVVNAEEGILRILTFNEYFDYAEAINKNKDIGLKLSFHKDYGYIEMFDINRNVVDGNAKFIIELLGYD